MIDRQPFRGCVDERNYAAHNGAKICPTFAIASLAREWTLYLGASQHGPPNSSEIRSVCVRSLIDWRMPPNCGGTRWQKSAPRPQLAPPPRQTNVSGLLVLRAHRGRTINSCIQSLAVTVPPGPLPHQAAAPIRSSCRLMTRTTMTIRPPRPAPRQLRPALLPLRPAHLPLLRMRRRSAVVRPPPRIIRIYFFSTWRIVRYLPTLASSCPSVPGDLELHQNIYICAKTYFFFILHFFFILLPQFPC